MLSIINTNSIGQTKLSLWPKVSLLSAIILLGACGGGGSDDSTSGVVKPILVEDNDLDPEENDPEENDSEENDPEENDPEENDPEENDPEENDPEENDPEENDPEENDPEENDPEENDPEENEEQDYNLATRVGSQAFYEDFYLASNTDTTSWSGNVSSCDAGSIDASLRDKGMMRLNYFRLLVGVSAVQENASMSAQAQEGALVSNRALEDGESFGSSHHTLPSNWNCYSQDAYDANSSGNLAYSGSLSSSSGYPISEAISGFVWDHGANNQSVGHRNNMLSSGLGAVGLGATKHIVVQMLDQALTNDNREGWWAWPAANVYVPSQVLYGGNYLLNNPRWSLRHESAFINWASKESNGGYMPTVEVTDCNGQSLEVNNIVIDSNYHLVWDVDVDYHAIEDECTFTVTVDNYWLRPDETSNGASGELSEFVYETTVFNPQ